MSCLLARCSFVGSIMTHKKPNAMTTITAFNIVENARIETKSGQRIVIGTVKPISRVAEVLIQPDGISRHKQVRKMYNIEALVQAINNGTYIGY